MKINDIELIYGLASRAKPYGISKSLSKNNLNLSSIRKIGIKEFDGAESYPWLKEDINYLNTQIDTKIYTKIGFANNPTLDNHLKDFSKSIDEKRLKTVYYHSPIRDRKDIISFERFSEEVKSRNLVPGISLYSEKEVIFLAENNVLPEFIQLPLNPSTKISSNIKKFCQTKFIARSIFLQSAYFNPKKFSSKFSNKLSEMLSIHLKKIIEISKKYEYSIEQTLLFYALSKSKDLNFKGLILSSSNLNRLKKQISIASQIFDKSFYKELDMAIKVYYYELSDPRLWK